MADWPTEALIRNAIGMGATAEPEAVTNARLAAIEQVKIDVSGSVEAFDAEDDPEADPPYVAPTVTDSLSAAALLLAVRVLKSPEAPFGVAAIFEGGGLYVARQDVNYQRLLKGHRRSFGIG